MMSVKIFHTLFKGCVIILPWKLKRALLQKFFGYKLDKSSSIGLSWIYPKNLTMKAGSTIGTFCVAVNLDKIVMDEFSRIGRGNWITGFPANTDSPHFSHQLGRKAELLIGMHTSISKNHHIDCTNLIEIGSFTTIAGYGSQFLTHSIDLDGNRQHSKSILIGSYCFVGTDCVILGGSVLPDYSVLGAKSLLNKRLTTTWSMYAGSPATLKQKIDQSSLYFSRHTGFVI